MAYTVLILGGLAVLIVIALLIPVFIKTNKVTLLPKTDGKPDDMRDMPPRETVAAALEDGEEITVFDYDHGEKLAAPFTEQIEDVFRAKIKADPALEHYEIDFGTSDSHALEIWVNGKKYPGINELPDARLKRAMRQAVGQFKK